MEKQTNIEEAYENILFLLNYCSSGSIEIKITPKGVLIEYGSFEEGERASCFIEPEDTSNQAKLKRIFTNYESFIKLKGKTYPDI